MKLSFIETMGRKPRKPCAFFDLNVHIDGLPLADRTSTLTTALRVGLSGIALNHVVKGAMSPSDTCKSRALDLREIASPDSEVAGSAKFHQEVLGTPGGRPFKQYNRLTFVAETAVQAAALNASNPVIRSYDLVAVQPTNQKVFDQACTHLEVDVITLDLCHRLPFRLKAPSVKAAVGRGIFFEVNFSGALADLKARRELLANAQMLQVLTRGRNIILCSGARRGLDMRGPNDVANIGTLFGLSREAAKASVSRNCEDAILHGLARKTTYKSAITVDIRPGGQVMGSEAWFDVPKVWDPLSNTRIGDSFFLSEETEEPLFLESTKGNISNELPAEKESVGDLPNSSTAKLIIETGNSEEFAEREFAGHLQNLETAKLALQTASSEGQANAAADSETGFIGIDISKPKNLKSAGKHKRGLDGEAKKHRSSRKSQRKEAR